MGGMNEAAWPPAEVTAVADTFVELVHEGMPGMLEGLYLHGSIGFGEWYAARSDIDYVAVLGHRPDDAELALLRQAHDELGRTFPRPAFDGFHCTWEDLRRAPDVCPAVPCTQEGRFHAAGRHGVDPVTWHELAWHGVRLRGPALADTIVWTDVPVLRQHTRDNLAGYWAESLDALRQRPDDAGRPETVAWFVLGTSRLHHLLATGRLTSKTGAGLYAEQVFDERWHPLVGEALSWRVVGAVSPDYDPDRAAKDLVDFTEHVVSDGLALPA
jgi:hypothetical protein